MKSAYIQQRITSPPKPIIFRILFRPNHLRFNIVVVSRKICKSLTVRQVEPSTCVRGTAWEVKQVYWKQFGLCSPPIPSTWMNSLFTKNQCFALFITKVCTSVGCCCCCCMCATVKKWKTLLFYAMWVSVFFFELPNPFTTIKRFYFRYATTITEIIINVQLCLAINYYINIFRTFDFKAK